MNAHVAMVPCFFTYNPSESLFRVLAECEEYYVIEAKIGEDKTAPSAVHKDDCSTTWKDGNEFVKMYSKIR
jgi:hypothetical protein